MWWGLLAWFSFWFALFVGLLNDPFLSPATAGCQPRVYIWLSSAEADDDGAVCVGGPGAQREMPISRSTVAYLHPQLLRALVFFNPTAVGMLIYLFCNVNRSEVFSLALFLEFFVALTMTSGLTGGDLEEYIFLQEQMPRVAATVGPIHETTNVRPEYSSHPKSYWREALYFFVGQSGSGNRMISRTSKEAGPSDWLSMMRPSKAFRVMDGVLSEQQIRNASRQPAWPAKYRWTKPAKMSGEILDEIQSDDENYFLSTHWSSGHITYPDNATRVQQPNATMRITKGFRLKDFMPWISCSCDRGYSDSEDEDSALLRPFTPGVFGDPDMQVAVAGKYN